jgi:endonuclease I
MTTLKTSIITLFFAIATTALAQGPNNSGTYYSAADGQKGAELKTALHNIIKSPSVVSYNGLKEAYKKTDVRPDGYLRDWYSNITSFVPGSAFGTYKKEGDAYNREHTVPQSGFNENSPMKSDIVHVVPSDGYINNMRSDLPFGNVDKTKTYKYSKNEYSICGQSRTQGYTGTVFEPNDEVKGDLARIYFYMATCYEDRIANWTGGIFGTNGKYPGIVGWQLDLLMSWSELDPVDEVETARNEACYGVQQNRNPFVDYPGLEQLIWGDKQGLAFSYDNYEESLPVTGITLNEQHAEKPVYNLRGMRVSGVLTPGIYIRGGKKFMVK